jgi:hypothetical protein
VDVLEAAEDLVDEGLEMRIGEGLAGADDGGEIAFHELCVRVVLVDPRNRKDEGREPNAWRTCLRRGSIR